jgi:hypothetical protein
LLKEKRFNFFIILWFNLILSIAPWFGATAANPEGKTAETSGQQGPSLQVILMIYVQKIF